jgi:hypothetical protein
MADGTLHIFGYLPLMKTRKTRKTKKTKDAVGTNRSRVVILSISSSQKCPAAEFAC